MNAFQQPNRDFPVLISLALASVNRFVALLDPLQVNFSRFDKCRTQVLGLPLRKSELNHLHRLLDKSERYLRYGELGAVKFELNLIAEILSQRLAKLSGTTR